MADGKIFICYRREDSAGHSGRIYDRLNGRFPGRVFMDVAGIGLASRWKDVIEQTLQSCEVAVILIGRRWLERGADGLPRLARDDDPLRAELRTALRLNRKIVPLLVGGAAMPDRDHLPAEVAAIVDWQALRIDDDDFDHDASRLVRELEKQLGEHTPAPDLDQAGQKVAEIRRLVHEAEAAIARADWLTATQTLRAVLSLEPNHAEAAHRLQYAEQQSQRSPGGETRPPRRSPLKIALWSAAGLIGLFVIASLLAGMFSGAQQMTRESATPASHLATVPGPAAGQNGTTSPQPVPGAATGTGERRQSPARDDFAPPPAQRGGEADPPAPPASSSTNLQSLAGTYALVSYAQAGVALPVAGTMHLTQTAPIDLRVRHDRQEQSERTGVPVSGRAAAAGCDLDDHDLPDATIRRSRQARAWRIRSATTVRC